MLKLKKQFSKYLNRVNFLNEMIYYFINTANILNHILSPKLLKILS